MRTSTRPLTGRRPGVPRRPQTAHPALGWSGDKRAPYRLPHPTPAASPHPGPDAPASPPPDTDCAGPIRRDTASSASAASPPAPPVEPPDPAVARHCRNKRKPLRVLWLDAHTDFNTQELSPSGSLHGMPLSCLCGFGPRELLQIGGATPAISAKWVRQVGIRSVDTGERRFVHEQQLEVFDMRFIDAMGVRQTMCLESALPCPAGCLTAKRKLCMEMIANTAFRGFHPFGRHIEIEPKP
jgi:hypothetical protein